MRNRKMEQELKERIVALREKERVVVAEKKQAILDLYIAMGVHPDHAVKML